MILYQILDELIYIRNITGPNSLEKKEQLLFAIIQKTQGQVLKLFDRKVKKSWGINKSIVQKALRNYQYTRDHTLLEVLNLHDQLQKIQGPTSIQRKRSVLEQIFSGVRPEHLLLVKDYYELGYLRITFNELSILKLFKKRYDSKRITSCKNYTQSFNRYYLYNMYHCINSKQEVVLNQNSDTSDILYKPMLASPYKQTSIKSSQNFYGEYKLDGIRVLMKRQNNQYKFWSRSGLVFNTRNIFTVLPDLQKDLDHIKSDFILDGEIWIHNVSSGQGFRLLLPLVKTITLSKQFYQNYQFNYTVFDIIQLNNTPVYKKSYKERRNLLEDLIPSKYLIENFHIGSNLDNIKIWLSRAREKFLEGLVLKEQNSSYEFNKRSLNWLKIKHTFDTVDVKIIKAYKGTGKYSHLYASFDIGVLNNSSITCIGQVGSGFTQKDLEVLKDLYDSNSNIIMEVQCEALSPSTKYDSKYALRFPVFVRLRDDKNEPNNLKEVIDIFY
jgi:ATP-dependent DNA ligase